MKALKKFLKSLRVFRRISVLEQVAYYNTDQRLLLESRIDAIEAFINSREPCSTCGHHRYKQKTLHYDACTRNRCNG